MRHPRWRALALVVVALTLVVSSCASSDDEAGSEGSSDTTTATSTDTGSQDDPRRAYEGTELNLVFKEGYEIEAILNYIDEFEAETGITVNIEVYDEPTARQKFALDSTSQGGAYDITSASFWNLPEFVQAEWLEPLDGYVDSPNDPWFDEESLPVGAVEAMTVAGEQYAIPHTIIGGMLFHRTDILEKHGLEPPTNTDEIIAVADALAELEPDLSPFVARGAPTFASLGTMLGWAYGYGALLFDADNCPTATDPQMVRAMEDFVYLMQERGPSDAASLTFTQAGEKFSSGQSVMMFDTSGFGTIFENPEISQVAGQVGFNSSVTGPAGNPLQWLYNEGLAISKYSKNKEAAWLLLQWRVSDDVTFPELLEIGRTDVPSLNVLGSQEYSDYAVENDLVDFTTELQVSWNNATAVHWPFYPEFAQIGDTFAAGISSAIAGQTDVPSALEKIQADLADIMARAGYCE